MTQLWNELEDQDLWTLSATESALLPGMTKQGRLGFAVQLKFMQMHGRFPERLNEIDPKAIQWVASQIGVSVETLSDDDLGERQGRRHRRTIRVFLGYRPTSAHDLQQLRSMCQRGLVNSGTRSYGQMAVGIFFSNLTPKGRRLLGR